MSKFIGRLVLNWTIVDEFRSDYIQYVNYCVDTFTEKEKKFFLTITIEEYLEWINEIFENDYILAYRWYWFVIMWFYYIKWKLLEEKGHDVSKYGYLAYNDYFSLY